MIFYKLSLIALFGLFMISMSGSGGGVVSATNTANCTNVNGDMFFNRCFMNDEIGATPSIYPTLKNKFLSLRIATVHMLHRASYPLVLGVGLYAIFRQRRPCFCNGAHIGSYYGMPSGDAMAGGILAAFLIDKAPFYPIFARISGILLMICVCFERTILGYHSVGQVMTGTTIGFFLHFYSTRVPQWVLVFDIFAQWVLSAVAILVDPDLVYASNDPNNLFVWFIWGVSFQFLVLLYLFRIGKTPFAGWKILKRSYNSMSNPDLNIQSEEDDQLLLFSIKPTSDDNESQERLAARMKMDSDIIFTVFAYVVFFAVNFLSFCFQRWNWGVKYSNSASGGTHM
ncbi:phosphoesterase [Heterostelium album PN500]|uniref:Phosphoesterase n=1 Tax=Heterostelium pallidum (strain ATCC 26659 / Pp 5 / PN500) TaxID=670386 RepID=D3BSW7_HETP5|nr:phosphoesterase [Heterostelium album PN500]EFA75582.1 phosphoesterase [Heterostelium album PN500]|eukprot:XP_020427716.1 phosphoesterase [Heterostelium album PN500]